MQTAFKNRWPQAGCDIMICYATNILCPFKQPSSAKAKPCLDLVSMFSAVLGKVPNVQDKMWPALELILM